MANAGLLAVVLVGLRGLLLLRLLVVVRGSLLLLLLVMAVGEGVVGLAGCEGLGAGAEARPV